MEPTVATTGRELDNALMPSRLANSPVAYVPTLGALHDGHVQLLRRGRELGDTLVVSAFVNPTQFGPGEDFEQYPRTPEQDLELCDREGVDIVFRPTMDTVYPGGVGEITVDPGSLGTRLEGRARPTHFRGVLTVLAKLFALVRPTYVIFGEKDYQQLTLVRQMLEQLCMPIDIVVGATQREPDGLAMSSRNARLGPSERVRAVALSRALAAGAEVAAPGAADRVLESARAELRRAVGVDVDYCELTAPDLGPAPAAGPARLLLAATVGGVRLIDNVAVDLG